MPSSWFEITIRHRLSSRSTTIFCLCHGMVRVAAIPWLTRCSTMFRNCRKRCSRIGLRRKSCERGLVCCLALPRLGSGPNGSDKGGVVPLGVSISGEPSGLTTQTSATLHVGVNRTGNGIPASGWPEGAGYTHYKWRLDGGDWSAETPIAMPIVLSDLANGPHYVEVSGKRDSGLYQDDPLFGRVAAVTRSRTWTVGDALIDR